MRLLIDTSVLISFYDVSDTLHVKAYGLLKKISLKNDFWITEHVVDEFVNIMLRKNNKTGMKLLIEEIQKNRISLFWPDNAFEAKQIHSRTLLELFNSKKIKPSYTDLHQIVVAQEGFLAEAKVFSFDKHFTHYPNVYFDWEKIVTK